MPASLTLAPTAAEVAAADELTDFIININASSTGNVVPIPKLKSAFETSIPGTTTATFTAEMYRDSVALNDKAWTLLAKGTTGVFYIARFGGTTPVTKMPKAGDVVEVWPVNVSSRTASALASNTAQTFTLTCSVPKVPNESATVLS